MPDVASELGPGGCGVDLGDGAGERLVIRTDYHLPPLDEVLELPDRGGDSQELPVEGGVPGLRVGKSTAEEGGRLGPPSMVLMEDTPMAVSEASVVMDRVMSWRGCTSMEA